MKALPAWKKIYPSEHEHMFLGLDSSTQSLTAVILSPDSGEILHQLSVNFGQEFPAYGSPYGFLPGGKSGEVHADPCMWLEALDALFSQLSKTTDLSTIQCITGSGQQHGSVYLDKSFGTQISSLDPSRSLKSQVMPSLTRPTSPIWMDTSSGAECREIADAVGGDQVMTARSGSRAIERFTGPQIRRFYKNHPDAYHRTTYIHLVSSFLASILSGKCAPPDFGDGAGMNLLNLERGRWDEELLDATAPGLAEKLGSPRPTTSIQGPLSNYFIKKYGFSATCQVALFTGDNPASLVGMGATSPGNVVISLGTSDTFFASMSAPKTDPQGFGHVFGNPAGGFMSLICFLNGSLARESLRNRLSLDWSAFGKEALATTSSHAGKNLILPFFGPEITPRMNLSQPVFSGEPGFDLGAASGLQIRALLESQFLNMRLHSQWMETRPKRIKLTGGASKNDGIAGVVADVFQAPVERIDVSNSAALGAALIAATACGHDLETMQGDFCRPSGAVIQPNRDLASIYDDALTRFRDLLKKHSSNPAKV